MPTLAEIKTKVRLLTQNPSTTQISDALLVDYINTFYLQDFPQIIQTTDLCKNISFNTTPNLSTYSTTDGAFGFNLFNYKNIAIVTDQPVYLAGREIRLYKDPKNFYDNYNQEKTLGSIGTGDGATTNFTYTLPSKILHKSVLIGTTNNLNEAMIARDFPSVDVYGREAFIGDMFNNASINIGAIDYLSGELDITFLQAPDDGADITYELFKYQASRPTGILFFDNKFTLRPVPDKVYEVKLQIREQPTILINDTDSPVIGEWWQYIAYGAAKKIFEDRADSEGVNRITPEFNRQKILVMRKTNLNKSSDRTATIFTGCDNISNSWYRSGYF